VANIISSLGRGYLTFWKRRATRSTLPEFIPFGAYTRPFRNPGKVPPEVHSPQDLPSRLFLGELDPASFTMDGSGWKASYLDSPPEMALYLEFDRRSGRLAVTETWRGDEATASYGGLDWSQPIQYAINPQIWSKSIREELRRRFNADYVELPDEAPTICRFPDGVNWVIVLPLPVERLRDAYRAQKEAARHPTLAAMLCYATLRGSSVAHRITSEEEQRSYDWREIGGRTAKELGLPPIEPSRLRARSSSGRTDLCYEAPPLLSDRPSLLPRSLEGSRTSCRLQPRPNARSWRGGLANKGHRILGAYDEIPWTRAARGFHTLC
jgi:hypothetical protein